MDHKTFLASLPPDVKANLTRRSDGPGLWHLAGHMGAVCLTGALILAGVPGWPALLPVQGVLIVFLFTLEHEATHKTPFANEALNEGVGKVCGVLLILPFLWFRYFHASHHRWTNIDGRDPELAAGRPETRAAWAWHISGLPYWAASLRLMARLVAGRAEGDFLPEGAKPRILAEARWMAGLYLALALLAGQAAFWAWLLPVVLGQPLLRLYLLAEHGDCPRVADMLANSRTTFTNRIVRFLAWNMPYHAEHHVFPAVPFHRLPDLHALMRAELRMTADGYAAFTAAYLARR